MKIKSTTLILMILSGLNNLYAQNFLWAKGMGSPSYEEGRSIAVDASGNVFTTGTFYDTADFDPGSGINNLISAGGQDIFIQKLNTNGNFLWAKKIGGTDFDEGYSITTDASGNVYATGYFRDVVDFDPGAGTYNLTSLGHGDIYVLKLDPSGNFLWAKQMGGTGFDVGLSIAIDPSGNVYTTGWFYDVVDFNPGVGTNNHTSAGECDIFIQKLDANGGFLWAKATGGLGNDSSRSIDFDAFGNVYTTGDFLDVVDFDPGTGISNLTSSISNPEIYVRKLDGNGNFLWAKQMGGISFETGYSIEIDTSGNVYTTGHFQFTVDFDPGVGTSNFTSAGGSDIFIQKLDTNGDFLWAKQIAGTGQDIAISLALDISGNVYTTGYFEGITDFDPGTAINNFSSSGNSDVFVLKLDVNGNFLWVKQMGGALPANGNSIALDASENTYITGFFYATIDFDPGVGISNLNSVGESDVFVQKMTPCDPSTGADTIIACDSYTWIDGVNYTTTSTVTHTLTNAVGCDSVVTLNLTINYSTSSIDVITACNSYTWVDGIIYFSSNNTATDTLTNVAGCDSIITLNLTINSTTGTDVITACNSYTWIDGITYYTSNNTATDTLTNAAGCDSIVTLNLTINNVSDLTTTLNGTTISSNNSNATAYQWLNCNNDYSAIPNETNSDFTAIANGDYAVEITENGCTDTSACVSITKVGLIELINGVKVIAYPNPSKDKVYLIFEGEVENVRLILTDTQGKVVSTQINNSLSETSIELGEARGIYFLEIQMSTGQNTIKLLKE